MSVIRKIYNGNFSPMEELDKELANEAVRSDFNEEMEVDYFRSILSDEDFARFEKFQDNELQKACSYGYKSFVYGFKLGMKLAVETLSSKKNNL